MIDALRELGVASRADVARHTGLSRTTISGLVAEMRDEGLVVDRPGPDGDAPATGAGRPPTPIGLSSRAGAALGIDFGKRHLAVVVADLSHTLLAEDRREMEEGYDSAAGMDAAVELVEEVLERADIPVRQLLGVGLGLPGPIHGPSGQVGSSAILPGWEGLQVAREMEGRLGLPVRVDNDANLGALAELFWGAGRGRRRPGLPQGGHRHRRRADLPGAPVPRRGRHGRRDRPPDHRRARARCAAAATAAAWRPSPPATRWWSCCARASATS